MSRTLLIGALAGLILAGLGVGSDLRAAPHPARPGGDPVAGQDFARRRCAGCHTTGLDDDSAAIAPRFRDIARIAGDEAVLRAAFARISAHGAGEMAPIRISPGEARDLAAYLATLRSPSDEVP